MRRLRLARMKEEREDAVVLGLIGMPKASIGKRTKLLHSVFETVVNRISKSCSSGDSVTWGFGLECDRNGEDERFATG